MGTEIFSGIDNTARRVGSIYVGVDGMARKVAKAYAGINGVARQAWQAAPAMTYEPVLADNAWEQIAHASENDAIPSTWVIGSEKDITVLGETLTFQIYDFKHDDLPGGGKAGITFGMKNLMASNQYTINSAATNVGGFTGSERYAWMHSTLLSSLPADLKAVIKPVSKKTSMGNMSAAILTEAMTLFFFSEIELFGLASFSFAGEGERYPIFTDNASRVKYLANGTGAAAVWWTRSPHNDNELMFCSVASAGSAARSAALNLRGICWGFCV